MGRGIAAVPARLRRGWPARLVVAGVIAMIAISLTGVIDHRHTNAIFRPISDAVWYCEHDDVRCDEARHAASVDGRWHARETGYKSSLVIIGAVTVLFAAGVWYQNQSGRRTRR